MVGLKAVGLGKIKAHALDIARHAITSQIRPYPKQAGQGRKGRQGRTGQIRAGQGEAG